MKKTFLLKTMLLLCALIVGGSAWADSESINCASTSPYFTGTNFTITYGKISGSEPAYNASENGLRIYANNYLTITPKNGETITAVTLTVKCNQGGSGNNKAYPTSVTVNAGSITSGGTPGDNVTSVVWSGSTTSALTFTVNGSKGNVSVKSIQITYTPPAANTNPTITFNNGKVRVGKTLDLSTLFSSNSTGAVTYSITAGGSYASLDGSNLTGNAAGSVTVKASQAATDAHNAGEASATITVYVQPTQFDINFNDTFFGTSYGGSASGITDDNPVNSSLNNVNVTYAGSGNHYINNSQIRFYPNNKLTFEAPTDFIITSIVFTKAESGTWAATISSNNGTYTSSTKTWQGNATSVLFTGSGSSRCDMSKATITLVEVVPLTISSESGFATLYTPYAIDFSSLSSELKAYTATVNGNTVTLTEVNNVPANTGVVLKGSVKTHYIPVINSSSTAQGNLTGNATAATAYNAFDGFDLYMLALNNDGKAQFTKVTSGSVAAGKAFLKLASGDGARELKVVFADDETMGIGDMNREATTNNRYFDLQGRRVAQPTKGLYIVNGKKVLVK